MIVKRTLEIILALVLIICCIPLFVFISFLIILETRKSPIISQLRSIHLEQTPFMLYKFRTLSLPEDFDTSKVSDEILLKPELFSSILKSGYWLRKTGLDELPQIFNILTGKMSFIGPRPLTLQDLEKLKTGSPSLYSIRRKIKSKPGISGVWQIYGRRELGIKNLVEFDYFYEKNKNLTLDIKILYKTILLILTANNADAIIPQAPKKTSEENMSREILSKRVVKPKTYI